MDNILAHNHPYFVLLAISFKSLQSVESTRLPTRTLVRVSASPGKTVMNSNPKKRFRGETGAVGLG